MASRGSPHASLFDPARLAELSAHFEEWFRARAPEAHGLFAAYRACKGHGMAPAAVSDALLAAAPHVGAYVAELFGITAEADAFAKDVRERDPIWRFKREFAKKRVLKADAGKAWVALGRDRRVRSRRRARRLHRGAAVLREGRARRRGARGRARDDAGVRGRRDSPGRRRRRGAPSGRPSSACARRTSARRSLAWSRARA